MPARGAKKRDTKSQRSPGAVAMTPLVSSAATLVMSGVSAATSASLPNTAIMSIWSQSSRGAAPKASATAGSSSIRWGGSTGKSRV